MEPIKIRSHSHPHHVRDINITLRSNDTDKYLSIEIQGGRDIGPEAAKEFRDALNTIYPPEADTKPNTRKKT